MTFNDAIDEAVAVCEDECDRLEDLAQSSNLDRHSRMLNEERALVCAQLADLIRDLKIGENDGDRK